MVTRAILHMWLRALLVCAMLCFPLSAISSGLTVSTDNQQLELGKTFVLRLHSAQTKISLDTIDLTALLDNFHIKNAGETVSDGSQQTRKITLYPRYTGQLLIPGFNFLGSTSTPLSVNVTPAIDPKDGSQIIVNYAVSTHTPWKKQQVLVRLNVTSQSSILVLHTPVAYSDINEIFSLDYFSEPASDINSPSTVHSTGWVIFPRQAGKQVLEFPAVELVRDGVTTHRFYPPNIHLEVKPLPVYIPATMPVGKLLFTTDLSPTKTLFKNETYSTTFSLSGSGVMPASLPSLASQIKSNEVISYYPATRYLAQSTTRHGLISKETYQVNFKTNQQGLHHPGLLQLNYFDPETGTIKTASYNMGVRFIFGNSLLILLTVVLGFSWYYLLTILYKGLSLKWRCLSGYYHVLKSLPGIKQPEDIKHSLMNIASAENWRSNLTLQQWHRQWLFSNNVPCPLNIIHLERMLYRGKAPDIYQLQQEMRELCLGRWPVLKILNKKGV